MNLGDRSFDGKLIPGTREPEEHELGLPVTAAAQPNLTDAMGDVITGHRIGYGFNATTVGISEAREIVAALLPLIADAEKRAAAAALREAAESSFTFDRTRVGLRARAAALDPTE